jgi:hypothetical protein
MKAILTAILLLPALANGQAPDSFHWLIGQWRLEGKNTFEVWELDGKQILSGRAFQVKGADTLVTEVITLSFYDGAFHYVPDVAGDQLPVDFRITSSNNSSFVAENPQHDFPKRITYLHAKTNDKETIRATIAGNGKSISYLFFKMK